jgi:hypothetical protein
MPRLPPKPRPRKESEKRVIVFLSPCPCPCPCPCYSANKFHSTVHSKNIILCYQPGHFKKHFKVGNSIFTENHSPFCQCDKYHEAATRVERPIPRKTVQDAGFVSDVKEFKNDPIYIAFKAWIEWTLANSPSPTTGLVVGDTWLDFARVYQTSPLLVCQRNHAQHSSRARNHSVAAGLRKHSLGLHRGGAWGVSQQ